MELRERAVKGVAWSALQNWGGRAINFVVFLVLARLLEPAAFGLIALVRVYIALARVFVDQGFADALIQREELTPAHLDTAFWTNLGLGVAFALASVALADPVAALFGQPELAPLVRWLAISLVITALVGVQEALFKRDLDYRTLAARELISDVVGGGTGVVMALTGWGVWSLVGYQLVRGVTNVIVLWTASSWRPGLKVAAEPFRDLFSFGINITGSRLLGFLNRRSDKLLIGYFIGPVALGFYDVAYRLLLVGTQLITTTVSSVAFSTFSRLQHDLPRMRRAFYTTTGIVSVAAFPMFVGGALLAPELIVTAFGAKWLPSAPVFRILAFIGVLHAIFYFKAGVLLAAGKPGWRLGITAVNAIGNVIAFVVTVQWGIAAVAAGYVVRGYVLAPLMLIAVHILLDMEWRAYFSMYRAPLASTAVMAVTVLGLKFVLPASWPAFAVLLTGIPLGAAAYLLTLWIIEPERLLKMRDLASDLLPSNASAQT